MNEFTLQKLEFDKIKNMLLKECSSSLGQEKVKNLKPVSDYERILLWQQETTEGVTVRRYEPQVPLGGIKDISSQIKRAEVGGILEPEDFLKILDTLTVSRKLATFLGKRKKQYSSPRLEWWAEQLNVLENLEEEIQRIISPEGEIKNSASPKLANVRKKIITLQNRIKEKLDNLVKSDHYQKYLQDSIVTIRGDRYVVPVKQEYRNQVPGIIHDQSASGATLFIEPMAVVELNNDLRKAYSEERDEILEILRELSEKIGAYVDELRENLEVLAHIDFIFAKARLSEKLNAVAPQIYQDQMIKIIKGRHPLIPANEVVPMTLEMGFDYDALVITGPNTGGKTVTLKTVGLFVLMSQSGLHIPAEQGSGIGIFTKVFADIGDEQSIEQSLSTFSSHMTNIVNILSAIDQTSLILLDELGAGTDPSEGAALAISILDYILQKGAKIIATTHYSELKTYAFRTKRVQNASVEFDLKTLKPTYRLLIGIPGKSNAFEIATRLGLKEEIVEKARSLISKEEQNVSDLIQSLEMNRLTAEIKRKEVEEKLEKVNIKLANIEEQEAKMAAIAEKLKRKAEEEALEIIKNARRESEQILKDLRALAKEEILKAEEKARLYKNQLEEKEEQLAQKVLEGPKVTGRKPKDLKIGQEVFVPKLNQKAIVLTLPNSNGEVQVQAGIIKINVNLEELQEIDKKESRITTGSGKIMAEKTESIKNELDFRGMVVDEALPLVDKYLDDAFLSGLNQVYLIHGKGGGVLRTAVRDMLKKHPHVKSFRSGGLTEGGTGVTVVELKK